MVPGQDVGFGVGTVMGNSTLSNNAPIKETAKGSNLRQHSVDLLLAQPPTIRYSLHSCRLSGKSAIVEVALNRLQWLDGYAAYQVMSYVATLEPLCLTPPCSNVSSTHGPTAVLLRPSLAVDPLAAHCHCLFPRYAWRHDPP